VRPAALVVYLHERGDRRGHYHQESWTTRNQSQLDEVHVSSHILAEGSESVFRTLLHEACHSLAVARGIQDTSRQGRYHNYEFAKLAHEVGLLTKMASGVGYVTLHLTADTVVQFENALAELEGSLEMWQGLPTRQPGRKTKTKNAMLRVECPDCHRLIRASRRTLDAGPILCVPCGTVFEES
jgi:hypothetical protein